MILVESVSEIAVGIAVEAFLLAIAAGVVYRTFSGRFLIPKREVVLPNQLGVIVEGEKVVRVAQPGTSWVKPKQRIVLCDARPRPLQMSAVEVLGSDNGIVRLSLSGEYCIADAAVYYKGSTNANDALLIQIRRLAQTVSRQEMSASIVASPELFAAKLQDAVAPEATKLGFAIARLQIWDVYPFGFLRQANDDLIATDLPPTGHIH